MQPASVTESSPSIKEPFTLRHVSVQGDVISATWDPSKGMNFIDWQWGPWELIASSTQAAFESDGSGLGPIVGPHFGSRLSSTLPFVKEGEKAPKDPFPYGIGRVVPWQCHVKENTFHATLSSKESWQGKTLAEWETQDFSLTYSGQLKENGLFLQLTVVSQTDSIVGLSYCTPRPEGAILRSQVKKHFLTSYGRFPLPEAWHQGTLLALDFSQSYDTAFHPFVHQREGEIFLDTAEYTLRTHYSCPSAENCWHLSYAKNAPFARIGCLSSQDPWHPNLTVSRIDIHLDVTSKLR